MKIKNTFIFITAITFFVIFCFTTCKKYPENDLWFKSPEKIPIINGRITAYKVNDIDSLDLLNVYYKPIIPNSSYPYNKLDRSIKEEYFEAYNENNSFWGVHSDLYDYGYSSLNYKLINNSKSITISGTSDTLYYNKQLFLDTKGNIEWEILYLDGKGKSKIKTNFNNNTYEITFEK